LFENTNLQNATREMFRLIYFLNDDKCCHTADNSCYYNAGPISLHRQVAVCGYEKSLIDSESWTDVVVVIAGQMA